MNKIDQVDSGDSEGGKDALERAFQRAVGGASYPCPLFVCVPPAIPSRPTALLGEDEYWREFHADHENEPG